MLLELMFDNEVHSVEFVNILELCINCHSELNHWNKVLGFVLAYST